MKYLENLLGMLEKVPKEDKRWNNIETQALARLTRLYHTKKEDKRLKNLCIKYMNICKDYPFSNIYRFRKEKQ